MADVFYGRIFHPLVAGRFLSVDEVRDELSQWGEELVAVGPGVDGERALDELTARLDRGDQADQFYRHRYVDEGEDDSTVPERWAFSYHWGEYIFAGLLVREPASGQWDSESALVVGSRISQRYWYSDELVTLAEELVRNTEGKANDQTAVMRQERERERAADAIVHSIAEGEEDLSPSGQGVGLFSAVGRRLRQWGLVR
ncbi:MULTISPECIES: hypothetical protein [unclassified Rhodococcus (in: high G+C Gram-positive bacteria)]|uniref:hypothetical protein n=1 Tax=unclassified Rhodococcus (in: high G+C Gram-positive bacteria) TaxID=192944 RepID=UPI0020CB92AE|nr:MULTISPECIES: hypothetical protein [unclassified Rhodococcus (in: high G+C Gram-positive bacteria)]